MSETNIRPDDKATNEWLGSLKKSTKYTNRYSWKLFIEFTGMTGDQILADRKGDTESRWEKKVVEFKDWVLAKGLSENTAKNAANSAVRGFFSYHRATLEFRRAEKSRLAEAKRKTEDYRFSRDDLKAMAGFGDPVEEFIKAVKKQGITA